MHLCGHVGQATQVLQMVHYSDILKRAKSMFFMSPPFCLPFLFFKSIPFPASSLLLMRRDVYGHCHVEATCHVTSTHQVEPLLHRDAGIGGVFLNLFLWLNQDIQGPA